MPEPGYRALIVDDEPPARAFLRRLISADPEVEVVGDCGDAREAIAFLRQRPVDLLFLDIQMPETDGFALLESLDDERMPAVVFVTAYDQYAVRAFEVSAVDFLLKPFDHDRLEKALRKAKASLRERTARERTDQVLALLADIHARSDFLERFLVKTNGRTLVLRADQVEWIEAEGNYVRLHTGKTSHMIRHTMQSLEQRLNPKRFVRIHRSAIINIDTLAEMEPHPNGQDQTVVLRGGARLTLSRHYRDRLEALAG
jgi:two-component system LytT family response regulator